MSKTTAPAKPLTDQEATTIRKAFLQHIFLLKGREEITLGEFAKTIRHQYGTTDPCVKETVETLRKFKTEVAVLS